MRLPNFRIICADVRAAAREIDDCSIDAMVTSPPYFNQRNYGVAGQIGGEKTVREYVDTMVDVFWNCYHPKLKPHGLLFLNLGDSYNGSGPGNKSKSTIARLKNYSDANNQTLSKADPDYKPRDLMTVPWRVFFALRECGYYLRSVVVWHKPNGMPESVTGVQWVKHRIKVKPQENLSQTKQRDIPSVGGLNERYFKGVGKAEFVDCPGCDKCLPNNGYVLEWGSGRPTSKYELVAILTNEKYYWDTEAVRTPLAPATVERTKYDWASPDGKSWQQQELNGLNREGSFAEAINFSGANLGNVWSIPTHGSDIQHFAMFPEELPELCIKAGTSEKGCCSICGAPYARMLEKVTTDVRDDRYADGTGYDNRRKPQDIFGQAKSQYIKTVGWMATCEHKDAEIVPAVVCDPFGGAQTAGIVANRIGRNYIGVELNPEYANIGKQRLFSAAPLLYPEEWK